MGNILLTTKGGDLLLQAAHTGQHGTSTQPANFTKVKQIAVLLQERMELTTFTTTPMMSTRLADLAHRASLSGGLAVVHQQRSCALLPNHRWGTVGRHACRQDGRNPGSIPPHSTFGHTSIINVRSPPSS